MSYGPWRLAAVTCAVVVFLGGCSGGGRSFDDVAELAKAVAAEGVPCEDVDRSPGTDLVDEIGSCGGSEVTLYVFDSAEAFGDWKKVGPLATPTALGPNWAVTGESATVERIAEGLGGELAAGE